MQAAVSSHLAPWLPCGPGPRVQWAAVLSAALLERCCLHSVQEHEQACGEALGHRRDEDEEEDDDDRVGADWPS